MRRRWIKAPVVLSLLLFVAVVAMWARSRSASDLFGWWSHRVEGDSMVESCGGVFSSHGVLAIAAGTERVPLDQSAPPTRGFDRRGWITGAPGWPYAKYDGDGHLLFMLDVYSDWKMEWELNPGLRTHTYIRAPYWLVALLTAYLPLWWMLTVLLQLVRRALATRHGCCRSCGYDLRATPDRCPECGAVPGAPLRPAA